ncbi:Alpha-amylase/alpha-mannosidase [Geitlerinema sp. FC II]|nr:Alpha-amylase/alpha-mannosidase [Geitlerinema sp. FC II]
MSRPLLTPIARHFTSSRSLASRKTKHGDRERDETLEKLTQEAKRIPMTFTSKANSIGATEGQSAPAIAPRVTAKGVCVTLHGHFYQPPRENPYLDAIEHQPSARPFHDWNERIHYECYRPNAFARVLNDRGEVVEIVNNYEYLSFNIGPTLMNWLARYDLEVYERILEADRRSCDRLDGHGNAIAQVYNHIILPLANDRDKRTQIRWGKADFKSHFGRDPEGMWLAETAVDYPTLEALIDEGIKFLILAPSQVERCRVLPDEDTPDPDWHEVGGGQIDPTRPYRCYLKNADGQPDSTRPYIDIFFYDGPISRDIGFNDLLSNANTLAGRLGMAVHGDRRPAQLISVATDGETFGHHKGGTEKCIAYSFTQEFPNRDWTVTNYGHYLSQNPPQWECELKPVTAWSCSHGVERWRDDCGCGGGGGTQQKWRRPLRDSLDWLRDRLVDLYEREAGRLLRDPWVARDEYIGVLKNRSKENVAAFLSRHQRHALNAEEQIDVLRLLEMQRHSLLMYTSCGWFFEELSRPEGTQILRYAARAIELAGQVTGCDLEPEFVQRLAQAPSNVPFFKDGAAVYVHNVKPAQVSLEQIAAHYAISSLFQPYHPEQRVYCYQARQLDYQLQRMGTLTLAVGQLQLTSEITWETLNLSFAVLHLGSLDFHCCIQPFAGRLEYRQKSQALFEALESTSAAQTILTMNHYFDGKTFGLSDLFAEEEERVIHQIERETLKRLDRLYAQVYRENYGVLKAFQRNDLPVPRELQVAAEIALSQRCLEAVRGLVQQVGRLADRPLTKDYWVELEAIATEAVSLRCHLNVPEAKQSLEQLIWRTLWHVLHADDFTGSLDRVLEIDKLVRLAEKLQLGLSLDRVQELYYNWLHGHVGNWCPMLTAVELNFAAVPDTLSALLELGNSLGIDTTVWRS